MYQPQQVDVVVEMAKAMEDGRLTKLETQSIADAGIAFGLSLIFGMVLGVLMRSIVAETLEPKQEEMVQPVIDFILPATEVDILDRLIREKKNDLNWEKWPQGSASDARKAVYKDILEGFRSLGEAREYVEGLPEDNVIYTARGDEIPFSLIKNIIADIERNPWLSPFRSEPGERSWQPPLLPLVIKCAWCGKYLGEKEPYEDKSVTHGICPECRAKYFPKKNDLLLQTHHSIPRDDLKRIAENYGWWAARQAEALCPHNDVACVEREAKRLYEVVKHRMAT
ncbi:MAG: hypothetical protein PHH57_06075 [Candidatus Omnitrophica bacterium]|nr:hypothetical protein [Candidatus Omnitrophota bacterium]